MRLERLSGPRVRAWWFDPRNGSSRRAGEMPRSDVAALNAPTSGEGQDWILVLEDAARGFAAPGR